MKMKALLALGLCLACTVAIWGQVEKTKYQDSVYITPFAGCRIILAGKGMKGLLEENNLEILKNKFIQDYQESAKDKDFPATAKNMIYLAGQDGRRRLKAIPDEAAPVNIADEIKIFTTNLPPFHYTIYDLMKAYQYHIYVQGPEELSKLSKVDCGKLIAEAKGKQNSNSVLTADTYEITPVGTGFVFKRSNTRKPSLLSIEGSFGLGLVNSNFTPIIGADFSYQRIDKYGKQNYQVGISYNFHLLSNFENKEFTNLYPISSTSLYFLKNYGNSGLGLSVGRFWTDKLFGSARKGSLDKAWKAGIISQYSRFGLEYDFIFDKQKRTNTAFTLRYYF